MRWIVIEITVLEGIFAVGILAAAVMIFFVYRGREEDFEFRTVVMGVMMLAFLVTLFGLNIPNPSLLDKKIVSYQFIKFEIPPHRSCWDLPPEVRCFPGSGICGDDGYCRGRIIGE